MFGLIVCQLVQCLSKKFFFSKEHLILVKRREMSIFAPRFSSEIRSDQIIISKVNKQEKKRKAK